MFDYHISLVKKKGIYGIAFTSNLPDKNIKKARWQVWIIECIILDLNNEKYKEEMC